MRSDGGVQKGLLTIIKSFAPAMMDAMMKTVAGSGAKRVTRYKRAPQSQEAKSDLVTETFKRRNQIRTST